MTHLVAVSHAMRKTVPLAQRPVEYWGRAFVTLIVVCWCASFVIGFKTALAVLAFGGFAAAIVGVFQPVVGLLGIGLLCTLEHLLQSYLFTGGLWRWHTFDYWLVLVAVLYAPLLAGLNDARNRLVQLFAVLLSLEVLVSADWYRGLQDVAGVAALFGLVVYCVRAGKDGAVWLWLGLVCGTTAAVGGVAFFLQEAQLPSINYNALASFPLTALFAVCVAFPCARPWRRAQVALAVLASANYTLVFLSSSRGTLLTATGCALVLLILTQRMRGRWRFAFAAALVALVISSQFTDLQTRATHRITLLLDSHQSLVSRTSGRSELLRNGWAMFLNQPLGVGTGGFGAARADLRETAWLPQQAKAAHAGWIKILVENGLPGITLMALYVLSFIVAGWRSRDRDLFLLGVLVALSFGLEFVTTEYQTKGLWLLAAAVMVLLRRDNVVRRNDVLRST